MRVSHDWLGIELKKVIDFDYSNISMQLKSPDKAQNVWSNKGKEKS